LETEIAGGHFGRMPRAVSRRTSTGVSSVVDAIWNHQATIEQARDGQ
jgi:hypothetical protein